MTNQAKVPSFPESKRQFQAFETYRDLGYGRSCRRVAKMVNASPQTVCKWARWYNWNGRLADISQNLEKRKEAGGLIKVDDPVIDRMRNLIEQVESVIDSIFTPDELTAKKVSMLKPTSVDELTKLIGEYRKLLEAYHGFVSEYLPPHKAAERGTKIDKFNVFMGDISQDERIKLLKGLAIGNVKGGNRGTGGGVQESGGAEVPERGDED